MTFRKTFSAAFLAATMGISAQTPMKAPAGGKQRTDLLSSIPQSVMAGAQEPHGRVSDPDIHWVMWKPV